MEERMLLPLGNSKSSVPGMEKNPSVLCTSEFIDASNHLKSQFRFLWCQISTDTLHRNKIPWGPQWCLRTCWESEVRAKSCCKSRWPSPMGGENPPSPWDPQLQKPPSHQGPQSPQPPGPPIPESPPAPKVSQSPEAPPLVWSCWDFMDSQVMCVLSLSVHLGWCLIVATLPLSDAATF